LKDFHAFIPILLLFQSLWKVFDSVDNLLIDDDRILKGEFMRIRTNFDKIDDLTILNPEDVTEEMWLKAFNDMNSDNNDFISFHEACEYTLKHLHMAFGYQEIDVDEHDYNDDETINAGIAGAEILLGPASVEAAPVEAAPIEAAPVEAAP